MRCGRFGHYVEGCSEKPAVEDESQNQADQRPNDGTTNRESMVVEDGPWVVIQKPQRPRRQVLGGFAMDGSNRKGKEVMIEGPRLQILNSDLVGTKDNNDITKN